ncbi:hypothetical protein ACNHYB_14045 [Isoptericola jiangsuensis]|uniref:hypothetical protein n=1 Tax=Isoptericola jiangsuensis TaxID=548579 RepID=UPI003AAEE0A7
MAKVFIHVGPHKTGSTYIQKQLRQHADVLLEHGVSYPDLGSPVFGHGSLVRRLKGWSTPVTAQELTALVDRDVLVLSSENFVLLSTEQLATLRSCFKEHEITIVFVLRSLTEVLPSHWQETIKHGNTQTFLEYIARVNGWIEGSYDHVVPARQLARLAEVFGEDALAVISYENAGDLFQALGQVVLGEQSPVFDGDRSRVNSSFTPERVELVRQLNVRFHREHGRTPGQHLRISYVRSSGPFERSAEFEAFSTEFAAGATCVRLSDDDPFVRDEMRQVAQRFGRRIVNPAPRGARAHGRVTETLCSLPTAAGCAAVSKSLDELYRVHEPYALEHLGLT